MQLKNNAKYRLIPNHILIYGIPFIASITINIIPKIAAAISNFSIVVSLHSLTLFSHALLLKIFL